MQDLTRCCGTGATPSQRAKALLAAVGVDSTDYAYVPYLESAAYLTGTRRARIIDARDRLAR